MSQSVSSTNAVSFIDGLSHDICSPFFDSEGNLHIIIGAGEIISITETGVTSRIHCTGGQPNGATYDADGSLYVADYAHGAILVVNKSGEQETVVSVYEDIPLKGPSSVISSNGNIYFTDSGPLGETGLHSPIGNVFTIMNSPSGTILKPISLGNLANPSGIALSNNNKFIYVTEMMTNRVLRYFQQPEGVYHGSVFYQNSGGVGPSCIAIDKQGSLYVGIYDTKYSTKEGKILVLNSAGELTSTITTNGAEISGLAIYGNFLYITEKSNGSILKIDL